MNDDNTPSPIGTHHPHTGQASPAERTNRPPPSTTAAPPSAHRPFSVDDLDLHAKITDLDCLAHPPRAVCSVRTVDREADCYRSHLWVFKLDGEASTTEPPGVELTQGPQLDQSPRWSPQGDGIAFLSDRSGQPQVHLIRPDGGEARPLSKLPGGVSDFQWAPDGRWLALISAVPTDAGRDANAPEVVRRLPYKEDGEGYILGRNMLLHRLDVATGASTLLLQGDFNVMSCAVSPDGRQIAYGRSRGGRQAHCTDLWLCEADGSNPRRLTHKLASVFQPAWSPDGSWIAFAGAELEGDAQLALYVVSPQTGECHALALDELEVADSQSLRWRYDGRALRLVRAHRSRHQIVEVDLGNLTRQGSTHGSHLRVLAAGDRQLSGWGCTAQHLVYGVDQPSLPSELWMRPIKDAAGKHERQVSQLNPWWQDRLPIRAELRSFDVPDGEARCDCAQGWLLTSDAGTGHPRPLLDDVHGGPASYALLDYDTNVFWQVLCSQGWAVLALNAVGSASYGRDFCQRLAGHWGQRDLPQHLAAIARLQTEGLCDDRLAIAGKSYGGYLSAWAIGHTPAFKAAVVMAPVGNLETHYGTSDGGYYADPHYLDSKPQFNRPLARQLSPLQHIEKATTPTLFLQGKDDERCPKCQAEELFVSLYRTGRAATELVLYPGESHGFLGSGRPSTRRDAAQRIIDWLQQHVIESGRPA